MPSLRCADDGFRDLSAQDNPGMDGDARVGLSSSGRRPLAVGGIHCERTRRGQFRRRSDGRIWRFTAMARIAMKIAYEGSPFSGYARQPRLRTVEGEVVRALLRARAIDDNRSSRFEGASRTDRGVSAFGNVVAFDTWLAPAPAVRAF